MYQLLLVTGICAATGTGRSKLRHLNKTALKSIYGNNLLVHQFVAPEKNRLTDLLKRQLDGQNEFALKLLLQKLELLQKDSKIFIDGSNYGTAVELIKKQRPDLKIFVFHHNVESTFFRDSFLRHKTLKSLLIYLHYSQQEKMCNKLADVSIFLTSEDLLIAKKKYKLKGSAVVPLCTMVNNPMKNASLLFRKSNTLNCLFLGGAFYANVEAAQWIHKNFSDNENLQIRIGGKGFDKYKDELESSNIKVFGFIDSVDEVYSWTDVVLHPIFSGSGMKTKIAEALAYGKRIISTQFGANGYKNSMRYIKIANNYSEFVQALAEEVRLRSDNKNSDYLEADRIERIKNYQNNYSLEAMTNNLRTMLEQNING